MITSSSKSERGLFLPAELSSTASACFIRCTESRLRFASGFFFFGGLSSLGLLSVPKMVSASFIWSAVAYFSSPSSLLTNLSAPSLPPSRSERYPVGRCSVQKSATSFEDLARLSHLNSSKVLITWSNLSTPSTHTRWFTPLSFEAPGATRSRGMSMPSRCEAISAAASEISRACTPRARCSWSPSWMASLRPRFAASLKKRSEPCFSRSQCQATKVPARKATRRDLAVCQHHRSRASDLLWRAIVFWISMMPSCFFTSASTAAPPSTTAKIRFIRMKLPIKMMRTK
mmetsp:Transcript_51150/g.116281  ORF Transcript_51150/g.116281 Transcript_51150/m.116281 type:complete len:287 (+) Transcript_51150:2702-3562(+)